MFYTIWPTCTDRGQSKCSQVPQDLQRFCDQLSPAERPDMPGHQHLAGPPAGVRLLHLVQCMQYVKVHNCTQEKVGCKKENEQVMVTAAGSVRT